MKAKSARYSPRAKVARNGKRIIRKGCAQGLVIILLGILFASTPSPVQAQDPVVYRAVLVQGTGYAGQKDAQDLKDALELAENWQAENIKVIPHTPSWTWDEVKTEITNLLGKANDNDVSLFYVGTHGVDRNDSASAPDEPVGNPAGDNDCTTTKCDEGLQTVKKADVFDDDVDEAFTTIKGLKILIFDSCWSGGLADGSADFAATPTTGSWTVISSAGSAAGVPKPAYFNVRDGARSYWDHPHLVFGGFLVDGLSDDDTAAHKPKAAGADSDVTLAEWFAHAEAKTKAFPPGAGNPQQEPKQLTTGVPGTTLIFDKDPAKEPLDHPIPNDAEGKHKKACACCGCPGQANTCPAVGGVAELPDIDGATALEESASSGNNTGIVAGAIASALAVGAVFLGSAAWYARRRWLS